MTRPNWKKMRANIPNKLRANARAIYEVLHTNDFHFDNTTSKTYGITRFDPKQIVINDNQGDKEFIHTVFHEFLHAVSSELETNLTENQVRSLEKAFPYFREFVLKLEGKK